MRWDREAEPEMCVSLADSAAEEARAIEKTRDEASAFRDRMRAQADSSSVGGQRGLNAAEFGGFDGEVHSRQMAANGGDSNGHALTHIGCTANDL